jgi:hypothetical protein
MRERDRPVRAVKIEGQNRFQDRQEYGKLNDGRTDPETCSEGDTRR